MNNFFWNESHHLLGHSVHTEFMKSLPLIRLTTSKPLNMDPDNLNIFCVHISWRYEVTEIWCIHIVHFLWKDPAPLLLSEDIESILSVLPPNVVLLNWARLSEMKILIKCNYSNTNRILEATQLFSAIYTSKHSFNLNNF